MTASTTDPMATAALRQRGADPGLRLGDAAALGAIQGPAELLPVSSSGHLALVPWLLDMRYLRLDPELRKSFEVAVHAGTAAALALVLRREVQSELRGLDRRRSAVLALSFLPAAGAGWVAERPIERRLGGPGSVAAGLIAGALALALCDRAPRRRGPGEAGPRDGIALGIAQASALWPGISRNGATLAAARALGFTRAESVRLSRAAALPIIVGATALKGTRLARRGTLASSAPPLAVGAMAAFGSTLASHRLLRLADGDRPLWPYAVYRIGLGAVALAVRRGRKRRALAAPLSPNGSRPPTSVHESALSR